MSISFQKKQKASILPEGLKISTMTITCKFDTFFCINNIGKYLDLSLDAVLSVKYKNETGISCIRTLEPIKKKKKKKPKKKPKKKQANKKQVKQKPEQEKKKKKTAVFYNQATVRIKTKSKTKPINVKLFKNGSIQMTGCISVENAVECMSIMCEEFKKIKGVLSKKMDKIDEIKFSTNLDNLTIKKMEDFKVGMINSNYHIGFKVDRDALYEILLENSTECTFEPCVHAGVNIKHNYYDIKKISVFVFESGSIVITGARDKHQIVDAYEYISRKLCENYNLVLKKDLDTILEREDIRDMVADETKLWRECMLAN